MFFHMNLIAIALSEVCCFPIVFYWTLLARVSYEEGASATGRASCHRHSYYYHYSVLRTVTFILGLLRIVLLLLLLVCVSSSLLYIAY